MAGAIFWMLLGALVGSIVTRLWHNANFRKAMQEERADLEAKVRDARAELKRKL